MIRVWDSGKDVCERLFICMHHNRFLCMGHKLNMYYAWEFAESKENPWHYTFKDSFPNISPEDNIQIKSSDMTAPTLVKAKDVCWNEKILQWRKV